MFMFFIRELTRIIYNEIAAKKVFIWSAWDIIKNAIPWVTDFNNKLE